MVLWNLEFLISRPLAFIMLMAAMGLALIVAITFHEFSHGLMAYRLGDDTARRQGRLSLNPLVHLDPLGTLMLFLVGFGWGKPVPVNPYLFQGVRVRLGMALVGLAGPLANLAVAGLLAVPIKVGALAWHSPLRYTPFAQLDPAWMAADVLGLVIFYSIILAIFNLIPIAPLDGFNVALGLLPRDAASTYSRTERYGPVILLILVGVSYLTRWNLLWAILRPPMDFFAMLLVGRPF